MNMCLWQPNFLDKSPSGKNDQKWPENRCFGLFRKICSLVLFENGVEWKHLWLFSFLWKPHMWEKSGSQVMAKNALYQKYPGFLHLDRHEWTQQGLVMGFLEKFSFGANGPFLAQNWHILIIGSTWRIFLKFCTMKGAKRYMELILIVFLKKTLFGTNGLFQPENGMLS